MTAQMVRLQKVEELETPWAPACPWRGWTWGSG